MADWNEVKDLLLEFYTPLEAEEWIRSPNGLLDNRRPEDCTPDEVMFALRVLRDGIYL